MQGDEIEELEALFMDALNVASEGRSEFIARACGSNARLKRELAALLTAHESSDGFMEVVLEGRFPAPTNLDSEVAGVRIGPYTLVRKIAAGGLGVVYEARQEQPQRLVALKIMQQGCLSTSLHQRFRHEVEILGRLQHPNIAAIYGAGVCETPSSPFEGAPYFAMELVDGVTLRDYANAHELNREDRLRLIADVCRAVHYAHAQGVIHRDLKPANILVTPSGQPKILDFGVARATESDIRLTTVETHAGQLIGTVTYMSPEQFKGDPRELDARSDVYALGVMLYELLSGRLPHDLHPLSIVEAARIACEAEPPTLGSLDRSLRGDIETIVGKALEKDRGRRYGSALELAEDIQRLLADEPIEARAPTTLYQLRKFARRNKVLVGGVVTAFALLIVAIGGTAYGLIQANREREAAISAAKEAQAISTFLHDMLSSVDPSKAGYQVTVTEVLEQADRDLEKKFLDQPVIRASLYLTIGKSYMSLGNYQRGRTNIRKALRLRRDCLGPNHLDTLRTTTLLARTRVGPEEAERLLRVSADGLREALGDLNPEAIEARWMLAEALIMSNKIGGDESMLADIMNDARKVLGDDHALVHRIASTRANYLRLRGRLDEADRLFSQAMQFCRRNPDKEYRNLIGCMGYLAQLRATRGRMDDAIELSKYPFDVLKRVLGDAHPATLASMSTLTDILIKASRYEEAEPLARRAVELARSTMTHGDADGICFALRNLANLLIATGRIDAAESPATEAMTLAPSSSFAQRSTIFECTLTLASLRMKQHRYQDAGRILKEAAAQSSMSPAPDVLIEPRVHFAYAQCLTELQRRDEARIWADKADAVFSSVLGADHRLRLDAQELLAGLQHADSINPKTKSDGGAVHVVGASRDGIP